MTTITRLNIKVKKLLIISVFSILATLNIATASEFSQSRGNESSYNLNRVENNDNNTIEIYSYNSNTGLIDAINYELTMKKTIYGEGNESESYSIKLLENYSTNFSGKYDTEDLASHIYVKQKDYSNTDYSGSFVNLNKPIVWSSYAFGGAITNLQGKMGDISGIFIGNSATTDVKQAWGGAILARGEVGEINADFIGNYGYSSVTESSGGALAIAQYNIGNITGDFIGNHSQGELTSGAYGGALYIVNNASVEKVKSNFIGNYSRSETAGAYGGALEIYRNSEIKEIEGDFIGNYADGYREATGGAVELYGTTDSLIGDFIGNYANSEGGTASGGGVSNIINPSGNLISNFILNYTNGNTYSMGGAISINAGLNSIKGDFFSNHSTAKTNDALGGAIYSAGELNTIEGDFYKNYTESKESNAYGGAIYSNNATWNEIKSSFYGNYAIAEQGEAKGGAIWTNSDMNFVADNSVIAFVENYVEQNGIKENNAVYVDNEEATIKFNLRNNGELFIKDNFDGKQGYNIDIIGENFNNVFLLNDLKNADLKLSNINLNTIDNKAHTYNLNHLTIQDTINFIPEVDFDKNEIDRFSTNDNYALSENAKIYIPTLSFLNEQKKDEVSILFAEYGLKDNVEYGGSKKIITPIYVYDINYKNKDDAGYFVFTRGFASQGTNGFNPAVIAPITSSSVGAIGTMNQTMSYSFTNSDMQMNIPYIDRIAMKNQNKYAFAGDGGSLGRFSPLYLEGDERKSFWIKPYAIFENVPLKNGPKVSNIGYGTMIGFDSDMQELRRGWDRVFTGYVGYNGASQRFNGVDSTQNGGLIGGTLTMYKKHFFNATTLSVGSSVADNKTMYGTDNYTMLLSGIGNKTGYNFEFKDGKLILQPNMLISYTMIKTFDYKNAAGVQINSKPVHMLQVAPNIKFVGNLKNNWQPYASVSVVWNQLLDSETTANGKKLPKTEIKPYVQYGVGLQKKVKDNFTAYGQAMVQNGGRNGISLTAGLRWAIGKDNK